MGKSEVIARLYPIGNIPGVYHASIVVFDWEYSYGTDGFTRSEPHKDPCKEIDLGKTGKAEKELDDHLRSVQKSWTSQKYDVLHHNCQHFAEMLTNFLGVLNLPEGVKYIVELVKRDPLLHSSVKLYCSSGSKGGSKSGSSFGSFSSSS